METGAMKTAVKTTKAVKTIKATKAIKENENGKPKDESCPDCKRINEVLSRVGDRWSVLVVIALSQYGILRFNALKRHLGISQRMLSLTLRELERDGLIHRRYYPTIPPKVEYSLTPMGVSFQEPLRTLGQWALNHLGAIDAAREKYDSHEKT